MRHSTYFIYLINHLLNLLIHPHKTFQINSSMNTVTSWGFGSHRRVTKLLSAGTFSSNPLLSTAHMLRAATSPYSASIPDGQTLHCLLLVSSTTRPLSLLLDSWNPTKWHFFYFVTYNYLVTKSSFFLHNSFTFSSLPFSLPSAYHWPSENLFLNISTSPNSVPRFYLHNVHVTLPLNTDFLTPATN